jgi:aryl-alcohol dehydrogenase-like predicted oxidoreductase
VRYTLFGRTGLRVSELALGGMTIGDDLGWGAGKDVSARIVDAYADAGGNFIDTANIYTSGSSERILGELLAGRRDFFVLAGKYTCGGCARTGSTCCGCTPVTTSRRSRR